MKNTVLLFISIILSTSIVIGQNKKQASDILKKIKTTEQVKKYKNKFPEWKINQVNTMGIDSAKYPQATNTSIGDTYTNIYDNGKVNVLFKVLKRTDTEVCKVQYIFFDGSKMEKPEIDSVRAILLKQYKDGTDFTSLVKKHTMDGNPNGELPWFYKGMMVKEFEKAVFPRKKGEIFTIDVDSRKWYYLVLKTHKNQNTTLTELVGIQYGS